MEHTPTIRSKIETELKQRGYSFSSFSKISGINRGTFSAMLNSNPPKPISVRQMDLITKALGYPEGWLYELYIEECFYEGKGHWKRIKPFLLRCVELGRQDFIQKVLSRLTEDLSYVPTIFSLAEELHAEGKEKESVPFYECVIENERYYHSERLAISQYRLFRIQLGTNAEENLKLTIQFSPFLYRLPEAYQLDALLQMANIYSSLHKWSQTIFHSQKLLELATRIYEYRKAQGYKNYDELGPYSSERSLVVYYGQALLMQAYSLQKQELYQEAKKMVSRYADLSWFRGLDEIGQREVEKIKMYATANGYVLDLLMGDNRNLGDYILLLEENEQEILPGILTLLEVANKQFLNIDYILNHFSDYIRKFSENEDALYMDDYCNFNLQLSIYRFYSKNYTLGIDTILRNLELATLLNNSNVFAQSIILFEKYKGFATKKQYAEFTIHKKKFEKDFNFAF
ncbi:DNA-binding protein [Paenibacillus sp. IHB B 3084]|uniref:helix-turn-helix domain-containing protein n=1 Tax=Paenibacillus sp. IHB B 3084 TaxID=867076 RepID=UPI00071EA3D7|nr:helix-turn-helix transcriptional regulator [Paenibacillus sp. IHB B 3084]ALP37310.1 DNA-binding protein [Paenibacillus sp. IHB B 3084]